MKKMIAMISAMMLILLVGCSKAPQEKQQGISPEKPAGIQQGQADNQGQGDNQGQVDNRPSLGKIHLGDSLTQVEPILGKEYKETAYEEPGHFPEPWLKREYPQGITVIVGKNSGKVLELETTVPDFQSNLGVKVGDTAKTVSEKYGTKYTKFLSPQGDGELEGFYRLEAEQLIIFDYNKEDESLINKDVKPESKVEKIRLTYLNQID